MPLLFFYGKIEGKGVILLNIFKFLNLYQDFISGGATMRDKAEIYLECDGDRVRFPVVPAELPEIKQSQNNGVFNSIVGDMSTIGLMGLRSMSLELFLPSDTSKYHFAKGDNANDIINFINRHRPMQKPFTITITKGHVTYISMDCVLNTVSYSMTNTADYMLNLEIVEYVKQEVLPSVDGTNSAG